VPQKTDRRFFDPREPGKRRKNSAELCERFNTQYPIGTPIRVYPGARWQADCSREAIVKSPGAFVNSAGCAVVKIPGDCIALTHVQIIQ
jgi:hypothetical protein